MSLCNEGLGVENIFMFKAGALSTDQSLKSPLCCNEIEMNEAGCCLMVFLSSMF